MGNFHFVYWKKATAKAATTTTTTPSMTTKTMTTSRTRQWQCYILLLLLLLLLVSSLRCRSKYFFIKFLNVVYQSPPIVFHVLSLLLLLLFLLSIHETPYGIRYRCKRGRRNTQFLFHFTYNVPSFALMYCVSERVCVCRLDYFLRFILFVVIFGVIHTLLSIIPGTIICTILLSEEKREQVK